MLDESQQWQPKTEHNGKKWSGPPQFVNQKGDLMMLHTDMALTWVRLNKCTFSSFENHLYDHCVIYILDCNYRQNYFFQV